ncbi:unnamed protein product [Caenorhabditis sp. 36 PRJEB53466]|nr:unnamed protein product [Caenorhabditis sp. 36 PRJEB53466]
MTCFPWSYKLQKQPMIVETLPTTHPIRARQQQPATVLGNRQLTAFALFMASLDVSISVGYWISTENTAVGPYAVLQLVLFLWLIGNLFTGLLIIVYIHFFQFVILSYALLQEITQEFTSFNAMFPRLSQIFPHSVYIGMLGCALIWTIARFIVSRQALNYIYQEKCTAKIVALEADQKPILKQAY